MAYITQAQRTIILNSTIIENPEFSKLKEILLHHPLINDSVFKEIDCLLDDFTRDTIKTSIHTIYDASRNEWESVRNYDSGDERCSLCHQPNTEIHYIRNKLNDKIMNVGGICKEHFKGVSDVFFDDIPEHVRRENEFKRNFSDRDFSARITYLEKALEQSPLLLPAFYHKRLSGLIDAIKAFREGYLLGKHGYKSKQLSELKDLFEKALQLVSDTEEWISQNSKNPLVCDLKTKKLIESRRKDIIPLLRSNESQFSLDILKKVPYPEIVGKYADVFSEHLGVLLQSLTFGPECISFYLDLSHISSLTFTYSYVNFVELFGCELFGKSNNMTLTELKKNLCIYKEKTILETLTEKLERRFNHEYKFLFDDDMHGHRIVILAQLRDSKHAGKFCTCLPDSLLRRLFDRLLNPVANTASIDFYFGNQLRWVPTSSMDSSMRKRLM